ncbi:ferric reduction oxidase 6 isoform X2 [Physcomitrium patens]
MYACPVIALATVALLYLELTKRFPVKEEISDVKRSKLHRLWAGFTRNLWTQPMVVRSPLGILTGIDLLGIGLVLFVVVCFTTNLTVPRFDSINHGEEIPGLEKKWQAKLDKSGELFGKVIPFAMTLLFLPVTRGSPILRLIHVPSEHAVRYHRWLGHLTMILITTHGVIYSIYYHSRHETHMVMDWKYSTEGISNFPGVIGATAGVIMWVTALAPVRSRFFNFFYGTHQLYIVLFVFYAWHVGKGNMGKCIGGIFLFFIDRFLRFVQSQKRITGVTAQVLPSGVVELKIPIQQGFEYNALSFMYINVPGISRLEWHPFSSASSSLNISDTISICIKPLGDWTYSLHSAILDNLASLSMDPKLECPFALKLYTEGPYGHESDYFLRYKHLLLVAGGTGITPFLAILTDLLKRHQLKQEKLPLSVRVIWSVRCISELCILRDIRPALICPSLANGGNKSLNLEVEVFVTRNEAMNDYTQFDSKVLKFEDTCIDKGDPSKGASNVDAVSSLIPTTSSQNLFMVAMILASVAGFVLMSGLFNLYVYTPRNSPESPFSLTLDVLLFFISTLVGIVVCGGAVLLLWNPARSYIVPRSSSSRNSSTIVSATDPVKEERMDVESQPATLEDMCTVIKGSRPPFQEIFETAATKHDGEEIGVLICGPKGLQESAASECRSQNFRNRRAQFHFHSVCFDL